jgi:hypothetical protein
MSLRQRFSSLLILTTLSFLTITGCKKDDALTPAQENAASQDAASVVAGAVGGQTGGINDQASDAVDLTIGNSVAAVGQDPNLISDTSRFRSFVRTYNPSTNTWTAVYTRAITSTRLTGNWRREYRYRYTRNGQPQQYLVQNGNLADQIAFEIVSSGCSGQFVLTNPASTLSHRLNNLGGSITGVIAIGADTTLTINTASGNSFTRSATDSLTRAASQRISNHTLTLTFNNIVVPVSANRRINSTINARSTRWFVRPISGTINGTYQAEIDFIRGGNTYERTINRNFTVTFGNADNADLTVTGGGANVTNRISLDTGELN